MVLLAFAVMIFAFDAAVRSNRSNTVAYAAVLAYVVLRNLAG